ncbi:MAG TPA: hypothetical protein VFP15_07670 [Gemmatimonadaceae bacterium]|nr:hypothetical protein [Gemmatimonadaceae bacterium]
MIVALAGIASLVSIVALRRAGARGAALVAARGLAAQYQWTFFFAQSFFPAVNSVLLGLVGAVRPVAALAALPIPVWKFSLSVHLTLRGFRHVEGL